MTSPGRGVGCAASAPGAFGVRHRDRRAACERQRGDNGGVPISQRAIAAVALEHLSNDTSSRTATYTDRSDPKGLLGADLRYGADGESDGDLVRIVISPDPSDDVCAGADGCETVEGTDVLLAWDEIEPEEDAGYVKVSLVVDSQRINVLTAGQSIKADPREQELEVSLDSLLAVVQDDRLRLQTTPATVRLGEDLSDWGGGEPDPHAYDPVPATDRSIATAYLTTRGGYGDFSLVQPSPLKADFGDGTVGARLRRDRQGSVPADIDVLVAPVRPGWLVGDPGPGG